MKYIFALVQVLTMIWLVALAFPQLGGNVGNDDAIIFDSNERSNTPSTTTTIPTTTTTGSTTTTTGSTTTTIESTTTTIESTTTTIESTTATIESTTNCPCVTTNEYNPVCGTDNVTYWNMGRFNCARNCNPSLEIRVIRACAPRIQQSSN